MAWRQSVSPCRYRPFAGKEFLQAAAAGGRDEERSAVAHALDPFQLETPCRQRRADGAADMRSPLGPIEAGTAEDAALRACAGEIDAELRQEADARGCHLAGLLAKDDE